MYFWCFKVLGHIQNFQTESCRLSWGCIDRLSQNHWRHLKQEAQLWQRDRAKLDTFSINVQRYSQNHAQNSIFGPPYGGIRSNICALSEIFNKKKPCSRVSSRECQFYSYNSELAFLSHPFWGEGLGVTFAIHPQLVRKLIVDFNIFR